jgi:hypothetical protein
MIDLAMIDVMGNRLAGGTRWERWRTMAGRHQPRGLQGGMVVGFRWSGGTGCATVSASPLPSECCSG